MANGKVGRPTGYDPEKHPKLGKWLARDGKTQLQIADAFGINEETLYAWKNRHPEFAKALSEGKEETDNRVVDALLRRATGYETTEEALGSETHPDGSKKTVVKKLKKQVPPDTRAIEFWLRNRKPREWRDHRSVDLSIVPEEISNQDWFNRDEKRAD